jgi:hypothetical protein
LGLLFSRALLFLQTLLERVLVGVIIAETSISLGTIEKDAQGPAIVLVFGMQVTNLWTLGRLVEGMQGWKFVVQDVQGEVHARLGQDGRDEGDERNEGVGELHLEKLMRRRGRKMKSINICREERLGDSQAHTSGIGRDIVAGGET